VLRLFLPFLRGIGLVSPAPYFLWCALSFSFFHPLPSPPPPPTPPSYPSVVATRSFQTVLYQPSVSTSGPLQFPGFLFSGPFFGRSTFPPGVLLIVGTVIVMPPFRIPFGRPWVIADSFFLVFFHLPCPPPPFIRVGFPSYGLAPFPWDIFVPNGQRPFQVIIISDTKEICFTSDFSSSKPPFFLPPPSLALRSFSS